MKLSPLLAQKQFNSFALESKSPQVMLMNDKDIPLRLSCDDYIKTFNSLMNVRRIVHSIRISPKGFNSSYNFKKGGTLSSLSFLNGCNKLSRLVSLGFSHKYLRENPFEEGSLMHKPSMVSLVHNFTIKESMMK